MKTLPPGNYALAIAHPGHELRLHGFLEQAKPFVFLLTDNSEAKGEDLMWDSIKAIDRATKQGMVINPERLKDPVMRKSFKYTLQDGENKVCIKDSQIAYEATNLHTDFFKDYVEWMVQKLIEFKINYLVCDSSEEYHLSHEIVRMICDLVIMKVKHRTGDDILLYDFALNNHFDSVTHEHCIQIKLNQDQIDRKLHAICVYPLAIADLEPNIIMAASEVDSLRKKKVPRSFQEHVSDAVNWLLILFQLKDKKRISHKEQFVFLKQALFEKNPSFFENEYLRPAKMFTETANYKTFIQPIYGKLVKEFINE